MNPSNKLARSLFFISVVLFFISLTQKSYCTGSTCSDSFLAFLLGWAGLFSGGAAISWLANPLLIVSWFTIRRKPKFSMLMAVLAFLFAASFLLFDQVLANEAGHLQTITEYRFGFWLWLGSTLSMLACTFVSVYLLNVERQKLLSQKQDYR